MNRILGLCLAATVLCMTPPMTSTADAQGWRPKARKKISVKKSARAKPIKLKFNQKLMRNKRMAKKNFKAFSLKELGSKKGRRKAFKKSDKFTHTFKSGRKISLNADAAMAKLNDFEKTINASGFSMRDKKNWVGKGVTMPTKQLNAQTAAMKKMPGIKARARSAKFQTPRGNRLIQQGKSWKSAKAIKRNIGTPKRATVPARGKKATKPVVTGKVKAKNPTNTKKEDHYDSGKMGKKYNFGEKKTLKVSIHPTLQIYADNDLVKFEGMTTVDVNVFNSKKKNLLTGVATIKGDSGPANKATALIKLTTLGKDHIIMNKKVNGKVKDDEWSKDGEWSYEFDFVVGPVPVSVEFGISYEFGVRYGFFAKPTRVGGYVTPFANSDAYAEAAVDLLIAEAGARGEMTVADVEAAFSGEAGLKGDVFGLYAYVEAGGDFGYSLLDGKVKVYLEHPFGEYEETLFKWGGIKGSINLFSLDKKVYLVGSNSNVNSMIQVPGKSN